MSDQTLPALEALRHQLDGVDDALLRLFVRRMELVEKISASKQQGGLPVRDPVREAQQLAAAAKVGGTGFAKETACLMEQMLAISREYQRKQAAPTDIP
ncbi:MAG: chorismate mutase [Angelakisella sp.]